MEDSACHYAVRFYNVCYEGSFYICIQGGFMCCPTSEVKIKRAAERKFVFGFLLSCEANPVIARK